MSVVLMHTYAYTPEPLSTWQEWTCIWMFLVVASFAAAVWPH